MSVLFLLCSLEPLKPQEQNSEPQNHALRGLNLVLISS